MFGRGWMVEDQAREKGDAFLESASSHTSVSAIETNQYIVCNKYTSTHELKFDTFDGCCNVVGPTIQTLRA